MTAYFCALLALFVTAIVSWLVSLSKRDVSFVDSLWSLFFLLAAVIFYLFAPPSARALLVLALVGIWAIRLSLYITWRNWGEPEDHRYQAIRRNNEPHFALKSIYIVFGLQALLAWMISTPLWYAITYGSPLNLLDALGLGLWLVGFMFEAVGDYQLARFKAQPNSAGQVMDRGLWRYTRHPNYFGNCCLWWGFYCFALAAGGWWTIFAPLLMTVLLLRVSGVALLEKDIAERRPAYRDYIQRTHAFFPGLPRNAPTSG